MPIYEYKCEKCKEKFEVFQGITDGEVKTCKFCGGPVDKLISLSSFHLKGDRLVRNRLRRKETIQPGNAPIGGQE